VLRSNARAAVRADFPGFICRMTTQGSPRDDLDRLAAHLARRREAIVERWCQAVHADPRLAAAANLPRSQFEDHVPTLLADFERCLRTHLDTDAKQRSDAALHGEQRWKSGYQLADVTREWGHLHLVLVDELNAFERAHRDASEDAMAGARHALAAFINEGICESNAHYVQLQKSEAAGELRDVERTVEEVRKLEQERAELLRQAAHDLRGNVGTISNATSALALADLSATKREAFLALLKKSVTSLHAMLDDVMDLARLQAGHESRDVQPFDAVALITETCQALEFLAEERSLYLERRLPAHLKVEGDATKTRRIVQNLLLNALRYTVKGGVTVECEEAGRCWTLCVRDTGPGLVLPIASGSPETKATRAAEQPPPDAGGSHESGGSLVRERGEGVGLSIVKRLCELLDGSISVDSKPGVGTSFRVSFPSRYDR
jgi:signal transduction histidine kinase